MKMRSNFFIPHPFPYQGSKRGIAKDILLYFPNDVQRLIEPFCGAAAISIAAAAYGLVERFLFNDLNEPLMKLWIEILERPNELVNEYESLWTAQHLDKKEYFFRIRDEFNRSRQPGHLLYLLARIVKGSVRYSSEGLFNQSADNRRAGMKPRAMRKNITCVSRLLAQKTTISIGDFRKVANQAKPKDLVYMDPPYQGTSFTRDHRYLNGLAYDDFVDALIEMNEKRISFIISYDGITGNKAHGKYLPKRLLLKHLYIHAGRSTQATLLGGNDKTIESLYLSSALMDRLNRERMASVPATQEKQLELVFA
uniref:Site-specific DNA-methyltransferase (adenine-specific) n=1 Tax=Candidatus Kentrum sp. UNK TaxID=2126344 RepID=A0A451AXJ5_9GAMM|nr:MAG: DNA adenine methylase [Candidatus Kentron sp. UNK]VFK70753.1 MAG: DNA adenine methylase [Candidatus Kentron sp. UNK]